MANDYLTKGVIFITDEIITDILNEHQGDIEDISSFRKNNSLFINVTLKRKKLPCPVCGSIKLGIKEYKTKKIKHSILNRFPCFILYRARRFICRDCGKTFYEPNNFVQKNHTISKLTVMNVLNELKEPNATFTSVANHNHISRTQVESIFDKYVNVPRQPLSSVLCIDEVYTETSKKNKYSCLLLDFNSNQLIDVIINRKKYTLLNYFENIPKKERERVQYVIMDMYETYRSVTKLRLPKAKIAVDSFHVIKNYNEALDKIRKRIMSNYAKKSIEYYLLKKFNWTLFKDCIEENEAKYNRKLKRYINYPQILELILNISEELRTAYELKSDYVYFNKHSNINDCEENFWKHIEDMKESNIPEILKMKKTLVRWSNEIFTSFIFIDGKRLSNGIMESKNGTAKKIKNNANGYRNFLRFRNRCLYVMNNNINPNYSGSKSSIKMKGSPRGPYKK